MVQLTLRTEDFDPRHRVAEFQSVAAQICKLDIEAASSDYASSTVIAVLPEATIADTVHFACLTRRTSRLAAETGDNILLHFPLTGGFVISQTGGREVECRVGEVYIDPTEVPGNAQFTLNRSNVLYLSIPRSTLGEAGVGGPSFRDVTPLDARWRMLVGYARLLHAESGQLPVHELARCTAHLHDLTMMALSASRESEQIALGRGVRAARLRAVQADIENNLCNPEMRPDWIAARQGVSARYLRSILAEAGTSFSDYVAVRRLQHVSRRLVDPRHDRRTISEIAYDCGFGDISWFNTRFRATFGMTPSEFRAGRSVPPGP